jgi:hypothetical protein
MVSRSLEISFWLKRTHHIHLSRTGVQQTCEIGKIVHLVLECPFYGVDSTLKTYGRKGPDKTCSPQSKMLEVHFVTTFEKEC